MNVRTLIALAGGIALWTPVVAMAEDDFSYDVMIHCAAVHMTASSILGMNDSAAANKDSIATIQKQAAALMTFASLESKKDTDTVMGEVKVETDKFQTRVAQDDVGSDYFKTEFSRCNDWGKAAVVAIAKVTEGK